jgi:integrase
MGGVMGISESVLEEMKISFYSGRHYWKTVMNAGGLGSDIEEYFMGHKVSKDVSVLYNHRDKQGKKKLAEKARRVFTILDKYLFKQNTH